MSIKITVTKLLVSSLSAIFYFSAIKTMGLFDCCMKPKAQETIIKKATKVVKEHPKSTAVIAIATGVGVSSYVYRDRLGNVIMELRQRARNIAQENSRFNGRNNL